MGNTESVIDLDVIKADMKRLRLRQSDLIEPLYNKGINAPPSSISVALSGKCKAPRFLRILKGIQEIIDEEDKR